MFYSVRIFIAFVLLFSVQASANPCKPDIKKFCKDAGYNPAKIQSCLLKKRDELSKECKDSLTGGDKKPDPKAEKEKEGTKPGNCSHCIQ